MLSCRPGHERYSGHSRDLESPRYSERGYGGPPPSYSRETRPESHRHHRRRYCKFYLMLSGFIYWQTCRMRQCCQACCLRSPSNWPAPQFCISHALVICYLSFLDISAKLNCLCQLKIRCVKALPSTQPCHAARASCKLSFDQF